MQGHIPENVIQDAKSIFAKEIVDKARELVEDSRVTISFERNRDTGFIISGLVEENNKQHATRLNFKKEEESTSNCDCILWNKDQYCPHVAALYLTHQNLSFLKKKYQDSGGREEDIIVMGGAGVHPKSFGTVIENPADLLGGSRNSTYASMHYILTNKKIVNFPLPEEFKGKLIIDLKEAALTQDEIDSGKIIEKFFPRFKVVIEDQILENISIFEYFYIYNWDNGKAYNLPDRIKELIKYLKRKNYMISMNDILRETFELRNDNDISLEINSSSLKSNGTLPTPRISIGGSDKRNFLDLNINFVNSENYAFPIPEPLKILAWTEGLLSSFKTKAESINFIDKLKDDLLLDSTEYKKLLHGLRNKDDINDWIHALYHRNEIEYYNHKENAYYTLKNQTLIDLIIAIVKSFTSICVRHSGIDHSGKELYMQVPKSILLEGISNFYTEMNLLDIPVFYNAQQVRSWKGNIKFERQNSSMDWFDLTLNISSRDLRMLQSADPNQDYVLTDDGLVLLDKEKKDLIKLVQRYTKIEKNNKHTSEDGEMVKFGLSFNRARIFELFELRKLGVDGALTQDEIALCDRLANMTEMPEYPIPTKFSEIARSYQVTGYQWLRFLFENKFGACLADDMGLGKTLQTIMFIDSVLDNVENVLIVCPVSILLNWQKEIEKFAGFDVHVYYGDSRDENHNAKVTLTSYGIMKKEAHSTLSNKKFDIAIFDEVQHLKNIRSLGANAARNINASFRICLTGTPVENDLSEFYNIIDLAIPGVWGDISFIRSSSTKKSRMVARSTAKPFILRRTKEQVLTELPDKEEQYVYLGFSDEEENAYKTKLAEIREKVVNPTTRHKYGEILKSLLQLRQLCLWQSIHSTKIEYLMENLEQIIVEGHKVIVFSQFTTYLDRIQNRITKAGWKFSRIDGTQAMKKRQLQVDEFQSGPNQIFLISLKAGGVGLNLTAANYIFLMDPWWNPAVESQAIDRAHRIGQENKLTVYRPIIKNSVEEKVLELQNVKRELFNDLLEDKNDGDFNGKLTMDDFKSILGV